MSRAVRATITINRRFANRMLFGTFFLLLLGSLLVATDARAVDPGALAESPEETTPLKTGDRAPKFTVRTVDDEPYVFDGGNLERPTILISFRGGWCPYCNMHLSELRHVIPQLRDMGYDLLFLSNDRPEQLHEGLERETRETVEGLDYVILSDSDLNAAIALGTAFRTGSKLTDYLDGKNRDYDGSSIALHEGLAVPAVYVIDQGGEIVFDYVNPNHRVRLPADELMAAATEAQDRH